MLENISHLLNSICVQPDTTIWDAMRTTDECGLEIVFVVTGEDRRLIGTITDGDIRRALLKGARMEDPVGRYANRQCTTVQSTAGRAEVLDLMRARSLAQIPIVDGDARLIGIHLLREIVGSVERPNWAVIKAGGRGERLRPITDSIPKPMIRVAGRPILERLVLHYVGYGIRTIFLAVNYMSCVVQDHFGDGSKFGCEIRYLLEEKPLGTAGALSLLPESTPNPILVTNGDLITEFDVTAILQSHREHASALTIGVREYRHTVPLGVLELNGTRVTAIREKPSMVCIANAGVYVLDPRLISRIPRATEFTMPELVDDCLLRNESVGAYSIQGDWIDVGRPADLSSARGSA